MRRYPDEAWCEAIHERLVARDPTAPAELVERCLEPLIATLWSAYRLRDPTIIVDAATDALLAYAKEPRKFKSAQRRLPGYLRMVAEGDLKNALAKERRRRQWETPVEDVELIAAGGNSITGVELGAHEDPPAVVGRALPTALDRKIAQLILAGERATGAFAEALGISHLPELQQRRVVKRHKDRIKKRLRRSEGLDK